MLSRGGGGGDWRTKYSRGDFYHCRYYVSPLTERWGHVAFPLPALSVSSVPFISASAFYRASGQTQDVDAMLG